MSFHYVYLLESDPGRDHHYVGLTEDLKERLRKHNAGEVPHTAKFRPWKLTVAVAFDDRPKAAAFEAYLMSKTDVTIPILPQALPFLGRIKTEGIIKNEQPLRHVSYKLRDYATNGAERHE